LLGRLVIGLGLRHLGIGALQRHPVLPAKYALLEVNGVVMGRGVDAAVEREAFEERGGGTG
jgi:hypothetical protein